MGSSNTLVDIFMAVYIHNFSWFNTYLNCRRTTSYDTPLFSVSGWKEVRVFLQGEK